MFGFYCCHNKLSYHKLSGVKQHPFIISWLCLSEVWAQHHLARHMAWSLTRPMARYWQSVILCGGSGHDSTSRLTQLVGQLQFLAAVEPWLHLLTGCHPGLIFSLRELLVSHSCFPSGLPQPQWVESLMLWNLSFSLYSHISLMIPLLSHAALKSSCDYTVPTQIIKDNLPILKSAD